MSYLYSHKVYKFLSVIIIILVLYFLSHFVFFKKNIKAHNESFSVKVAPPVEILWNDTISAIGTVKAIRAIKLKSTSSGIVRDIRFRSGSKVKKGDILVTLADEEVGALLKESALRYEQAKQQYFRYYQLFKQHIVAAAEIEKYKASMQEAEAKLAYQQALFDKTRIVAPFSGRIGIFLINRGQVITEGENIVSISTSKNKYVDFNISERFIHFVKIGGGITCLFGRGKKIYTQGNIIAKEAIIDEVTQSLRVRALIVHAPQALNIGEHVLVLLAREAPHLALFVPQSSIIYTPYSNFIYSYREGRVYQKPVELGVRNHDLVLLKKGIAKNELIVLSGIQKLHNGEKVKVVK